MARPLRITADSQRSMPREHGQIWVLGIGIGIGTIALLTVLAAIGSVWVARAELNQALDTGAVLAVTQPLALDTGDVGRLVSAGGATRFEAQRSSDGATATLTASVAAPNVLGVADGARITVTRTVELPVFSGGPAGVAVLGSGVYVGPLVRVDSAALCPRVASALIAMQRAARESGVTFPATSGYRTYAEQAILYARLGPRLAAAPGTSLHHAATEVDLSVGPAGSSAHRWLRTHGPGFGFIQRYSWEPWHWGFVAGCGDGRDG